MPRTVELPILAADALDRPGPSWRAPLPAWLKRPLPAGAALAETDRLIDGLGLNTVCSEAKCPNRTECWSRGTATFMVLGRVCTRPCGFCAVERGKPPALEADEPQRVAEAAQRLGLKHVVLTSVTRDELLEAFADLRKVGVELLTIGQYLQPTPKLLPVERYVPPEEFAELGRLAERLGFKHVASGPFVRSSYHADEAWQLATATG